MDVFEHLNQAGGIARTAQLLSAGYSRRDIGQLTDRGAAQPRRGIFLAPDCDVDLAAAIQHNGRLTCASAAAHYGLWLRKPPARLHLACNHGHGVPLELLRNQLRGDRSAPVRRALQELDLRAESIVEVDAQHLFRSNGIEFEAQVLLPDIGRVDFLLASFLIVEIDGFAFHSKRGDMLRDRHRNNTSTVQGFAVLRYMPEHIWFNPEKVVAEIQAVLTASKRPTT